MQQQQFDQAIAVSIDLWHQATGHPIPDGLFDRYFATLEGMEPWQIVGAMKKAVKGAWIEGYKDWPTSRDLWRLAGGDPEHIQGKLREQARTDLDKLLAWNGPLKRFLRFGKKDPELDNYKHILAALPQINELDEIDRGDGAGREPWEYTAAAIKRRFDIEAATKLIQQNESKRALGIADHSLKAKNLIGSTE